MTHDVFEGPRQHLQVLNHRKKALDEEAKQVVQNITDRGDQEALDVYMKIRYHQMEGLLMARQMVRMMMPPFTELHPSGWLQKNPITPENVELLYDPS